MTSLDDAKQFFKNDFFNIKIKIYVWNEKNV